MSKNSKEGALHPLILFILIIVGLIALSNIFSSSNTSTQQTEEKNVTTQKNTPTQKRNGEIPTLTLYNTANAQSNKTIIKTALSALTQAQEIQTGKNIKPTDLSSDGLAKYYNEQMNCQISVNKLFCISGYEYIFLGDGNCNTSDGCYVIIDVNGEKGPNEEWTDPNTPKDRVKYTLIKEKNNGGLAVKMPDFFY